MKPAPSPTKQWALKKKLPVVQLNSLLEDKAIEALKELKADYMVVVAFGLFIPSPVRKLFRLCVNFHPSLLPKNRGAAPIQRAILKGEKVTGVTAHLITDSMDAGDVIWQKSELLLDSDTAGTLSDRLAQQTAEGLKKVLSQIKRGEVEPKPQDERQASYAPRLSRHEEKIYWNLPAELLLRQIRALHPKPGAYTLFRGKRLKVWQAKPAKEALAPAEAFISKGKLLVGTATHALEILDIQIEGKKPMKAENFIRGLREKSFALETF